MQQKFRLYFSNKLGTLQIMPHADDRHESILMTGNFSSERKPTKSGCFALKLTHSTCGGERCHLQTLRQHGVFPPDCYMHNYIIIKSLHLTVSLNPKFTWCLTLLACFYLFCVFYIFKLSALRLLYMLSLYMVMNSTILLVYLKLKNIMMACRPQKVVLSYHLIYS